MHKLKKSEQFTVEREREINQVSECVNFLKENLLVPFEIKKLFIYRLCNQ